MGQLHAFTCPACGYRADVCGGKDIGLHAVLATVACRNCKALFDARADQEAADILVGGRTRGRLTGLTCPENPDHCVVQWRHPWACPKCGERMVKGGTTLCWD